MGKEELEFNPCKLDFELLDDAQIQELTIRSTIELARRKKISISQIARDMLKFSKIHRYLRNQEKYILK